MYMYVIDIDYSSFNDFSTGAWKCSESIGCINSIWWCLKKTSACSNVDYDKACAKPIITVLIEIAKFVFDIPHI